jgi:hypothetical protein
LLIKQSEALLLRTILLVEKGKLYIALLLVPACQLCLPVAGDENHPAQISGWIMIGRDPSPFPQMLKTVL